MEGAGRFLSGFVCQCRDLYGEPTSEGRNKEMSG